MKIFSGTSNPELSNGIMNNLKTVLGKISHNHFPSGESYCQFNESIRGNDVFLIQGFAYPTNDSLMELLLMGDAARRASAGRITAVCPMFFYTRQDKKDKPRVPISAKLVMDLIKASGFNRILTMDLHAPQIGGFTNLPFDHLSFKPALVNAVGSVGVDCVVAPDVGSVKRADEYASALNTDLAIITKKRKNSTTVEAKQFVGDVSGKKVIIIDDLTESAGTLIEAATACKEKGASEIYCAITHGCFTEIGAVRLFGAFEHDLITKLFVSNTVSPNWDWEESSDFGQAVAAQPRNFSDRVQYVDVAPLFAQAIQNIHDDKSVSSLFQ